MAGQSVYATQLTNGEPAIHQAAQPCGPGAYSCCSYPRAICMPGVQFPGLGSV